MTYARARLWLGITGVGSLVVIAAIAIATGLPQRLLSSSQAVASDSAISSPSGAILQFAAVFALLSAWMLPFDFLGGFWFPRRFGKTSQSFLQWLMSYLPAIAAQWLVYTLLASLILVAGTAFGLTGAVLTVAAIAIAAIFLRGTVMTGKRSQLNGTTETEREVVSRLASARAVLDEKFGTTNVAVASLLVAKHHDVGFTGGIIGVGRRSQIVLPEAWVLQLSAEQLAVTIARRSLAIADGSYVRSLCFALTWTVGGLLLCSLLPGAGVDSVAGLVNLFCWFTLWSFVGLLTLPTVSRKATLALDNSLSRLGFSSAAIRETAISLDRMQDDEPGRPKWIETIFHPLPNAGERATESIIKPSSELLGAEGETANSGASREITLPAAFAWNLARTTIFLSGSCCGFLARAVHCNVGRPELWLMLPTD